MFENNTTEKVGYDPVLNICAIIARRSRLSCTDGMMVVEGLRWSADDGLKECFESVDAVVAGTS